MNFKIFVFIGVIVAIHACTPADQHSVTWSLVWCRPGQPDTHVVELPADISKPFTFHADVDSVGIDFSLRPQGSYTVFAAKALRSRGKSTGYFSLQAHYGQEVPYTFNGEVKGPEIFRQSPHDVNAWIVKDIAEQAVPVVALKADSLFFVAVSGSPALYDNFTSQAFYTDRHRVALSSGDNGASPGLRPDTVRNLDMEYNTDKQQIMSPGKILSHYHAVGEGRAHTFEGILFTSHSQNLNGLRKDVNQLAARHFSNGRYTDYFGALSFTTAYMNLRVNETGKSTHWVVPSVEYGNTQYCRDAFWISTMLAPEASAECLKNELAAVNEYAEYPLFAVIWAYRAVQAGNTVPLQQVQRYVDAIETRARDGYFYSYLESDGRLDFQYWGDVIAFEKDDVVTYNQGLFALALTAARNLGLRVKTDPAVARNHYRNMFRDDEGFYPVSKKKNSILGPDPLVPDLVSQVYFGTPLLETATVRRHYEKVVSVGKSRFGLKVYCLPNGDYLPASMYDIPGYVSQVNREKMPDGRYLKGGSYFLYDNLFLIDAYLHGIKEAEDELIWRTTLDFSIGSTTYECLNTKTGEPWKPNMGWNVAVYAIWRKLLDEGKVSSKLFDRIDAITSVKQKQSL